jgi:murein DD-endopeptidase MepM/ murein hydrolase activator NlpD
MYNKKAQRPQVKSIRELINHKSHVQKKYFSLMLVPSYSTGRTRSLRIPYGVFYFVIISVFCISAVIAGFYLRSNYFMRMAQSVSTELDQAQEAYIEMQNNLTDEQNRLMDNANQLKSQLSEEQQRFQSEKSQVRQEYQETLEDLQDMVYDLELKLQELDETRLEVISQLGVKAFIPPIRAILNEIEQAQTAFLSAVSHIRIRSDERNPSAKTTEQDLRDYYTLLTARLEAQLLCFADLTRHGVRIQTYAANYPTRWPIRGQVTSGYGYRTNPMGGSRGEHHDGIDIRTPIGTNVHATGGGTVRQAEWGGSYGYIVIIDHGFGIQTLYAHNSRNLVSAGQRVERGDVIAKSGSTGRSTGPHVHYEVRVNGKAVNPWSYFFE